MMERNLREQLVEFCRAPDAAAPSVTPVDVHLRSGVSFVLRDPMRRGVPSARQDVIKRGLEKGWLLGAFVSEWGYDVRRELIPQFHRWLEVNEGSIVGTQPEGVSYRGTYAVFSTSEKGSGSYRTVWTFSSFAGMQDFGYFLADETRPFARVVTELVRFIDRDRHAGTSQQIYQPAQGSTNLAALGLPPVAPPVPPP
jgi:hypothetical protein